MDFRPPAGRIEVDPGASQLWVMVAQSARLLRDLLNETPAPVPGSPFEMVDENSPEPSVLWCRSYLSSALEHLGMWADFVAPLDLHPEAAVHHEARPAQTLARAALESASQAVWIMAPDNAPEMLRRHLSLVLEDWSQQRKAAIDRDVQERIERQRMELVQALEENEVKVDRPSYLALVVAAADETRKASPADVPAAEIVERLWRASAGSAHGKRWPSIELSVSVEVGGRTYSFPDADAMSAMLALADRVTRHGVVRFIQLSGHSSDLARRMAETAARWYDRMPKRPGAPRRLGDIPGYPAEGT